MSGTGDMQPYGTGSPLVVGRLKDSTAGEYPYPTPPAPDPATELKARPAELRAAFAAGAQFQAHYVARDYPDGLYHEKPVMHEARSRYPDAKGKL